MTTFLDTPQQASRWCQRQRDSGKSLGYVPTMGALHEGHLSLVRRSVSENDVTCVSIFVNPLQFDNPGDLDSYPRSMESDLAMLQEAECDMAYTGDLETFFPDQSSTLDNSASLEPVNQRGLEADYRPGHLEGVKAIVERLFATVGQCRAYFGEKDFQQTLLVKDLANRHGEIDVVVCSTVREASGLAMSSRNRRLSTAALELASCLYQALVEADNAWRQGQRNPLRLEQLMQEKLDRPGIEIEYATVRDPRNWTVDTPTQLGDSAQALIAAYIDGVRLIDNLALGSNGLSKG